MDDESLMMRVRDEDCTESFCELVQRWTTPIHQVCFRMTGDWQDAEDLTQDVFARLYRSRRRYAVRASFGAFIRQVALNRIRDLVRKRQRIRRDHEALRSHPASRSIEVDATQRVELVDEVQQALMQLPEHYRQVVVLRHYENLTFRQVAVVLDIPEGTVASRMAKALRLLEKYFSDIENEKARHETSC